MVGILDNPTTEDVLRFISKSVIYGNLGLFVGAGLSKAVLNSKETVALSRGELLEKACEQLEVDYEVIAKDGVDYPHVASDIVKAYASAHAIDFQNATAILKREIAGLTAWYPDKKQRDTFSNYLLRIRPAWIVTTNYDMILESILTGKSISLGPNDQLSSSAGTIPIFHLHGVRSNPSDIIITTEDYVALFRPTEYRQIKLALTVRESTTLILGYGMGDVNVLTALDWSRNVYKSEQSMYPNEVIQIVYSTSPRALPFRDHNSVLIQEVDDLEEFFKLLLSTLEHEEAKYNDLIKRYEEYSQELENANKKRIGKFIDDSKSRQIVLKNTFPNYLSSGFISFLSKCLDETWSRSAPSGAFEGYNQNLIILLDILAAFKLSNIPPALLQTTVYALEQVAPYVGNSYGQSFAAKITWDKRRYGLSEEILEEIKRIAHHHRYSRLLTLLED